jgi:hypothetical protein
MSSIDGKSVASLSYTTSQNNFSHTMESPSHTPNHGVGNHTQPFKMSSLETIFHIMIEITSQRGGKKASAFIGAIIK